jgi:rhodanese-related sulfurtransferase
MITNISPASLFGKITAGERPLLLDVRTPREYASAHVPDAIRMPLESLDPLQVATLLPPGQSSLYVICQSGSRARKAIAKLEAAGVKCCVLVEGGTSAWIQAGLPVQRQQVGGISLERQVRIAAGSLIFVGTLLATFLHPLFLIIPGFIGSGLVFAGITDICGMALLLARMPWNQVHTRNDGMTCSASSKGAAS